MSDHNKKKNEWLTSLLKPTKDGKKLNRKSQYILLILGFGIAMMLVQNLMSATEPASVMNMADGTQESKPTFSMGKSDDPSSLIRELEEHYENQLKELLDEMIGVQNAEVMVVVDSTYRKVIEKEINKQISTTDETDKNGGKRKSSTDQTSEKVIIIDGKNGKEPIIRSIEKPKVTGVLIVAEGADSLQVKNWIIEAVSKVFDMPSHKVSVTAKKQKGE
ncbi:stage III sporulation protein AG [Pseudalkalibacillus berkeleyi]|uniref:Stage III sporulation protein AG n=1 Tax=Pseudalkalibacillus berkeleyi TaxID=1069813 RepID=A0ABS9H1S7_9BACL|nr:stage III sporulation protein AG [Pseudalkalibacillus berkeleyi]MCF6137856.1 stage III sporulation protein AG [Pseudalkalibacillus berkeleyi]